MPKKRIHEIAKEHGLPSSEIIDRLEKAGIEGKVAFSMIDESVALDVLENGQAPVTEASADGAARAGGANGRPQEAPAQQLPTDAQSGRRGGPLFWLKTVVVVLLKGDGKSATGQPATGAPTRATPRAPVRVRPSTERAPRPPVTLPAPAQLRRAGFAIAGVALVLAIGAWLLGAFDGDTQRQAAQAPKQRPLTFIERQDAALRQFSSVVAAARHRSIAVYRSPGRRRPFKRMSNPNVDGAPLVFLVKRKTARWLWVYLPARPNGSTGWIRRSQVVLSGHNFRVKISLGRHRLTAWEGRNVIMREPIGVGRAVTPTPAGLYFITELLKQPEPDGPYGPFAFGLSVYSNILTEFAGADGILGLHGTNDPAAIGTDVSHGCIRMSNDAITKLAHVLPAGTPVRITA